ncbi:MAG TPA: alpha/beta fold hydrolase [Acidimicrobiia bacterium]|nr:alpha/beta fold hydrolase [Acidimicrobiia bacterium]
MSRLPGLTGNLDWSVANPGGDRSLVLLHSLGTDRTLWEGQVNPLIATGRRVIAIDLPGHGRSTAGIGPYTIDTVGKDVSELIELVEPGSFEIMGISFGGLVGLWLAITAPERVSALVAANTSGRLGSKTLWDDRIAAVRRSGLGPISHDVLARFFAPDFASDHPDLYARFSEVFSSTDPVGYTGCCTILRDTDLTDQVGSISCPVLVVGGDLDVATPPDQIRTLHRQIEGSLVEVIQGAAHLSNVDRPDAYNQIVGDFLSVV